MADDAILDELQARGLVEQMTNEERLRERLRSGGLTAYVGVDPTADSIHVGHLLPILTLARMQACGHRPIILIGGATGMIGDPSGKSAERNLLTIEEVRANADALKAQISRFVSFEGDNAALMTNNYDWIGPLTYIEWLRDVGKHFSINYMIAKESVRRRLEDRDQGISYTEFSYMLLQAYDFYELHERHGCQLQVGGSDQWGNITAGIELIRRKSGGEALGLTFPLVTTASGEKFGKSAGNAVWLDPARTSFYDFYQYFVRTDDRDVRRYLCYFTFRSVEEIDALMAEHEKEPHRRQAQQILAEDLTRLVHGEAGLERAKKATEILFGREIEGLDDDELSSIFADVPAADLSREQLVAGYPIVELLADSGICSSKGDARRALKQGGVYINNVRAEGEEQIVDTASLASQTIIVLRRGKKNYRLARFSA